ncbi:MAG: polysaccharide deacetylase family protein [Bifidobacterium sp.]|jgi:peptidoglycan/xylan/chitin deacetylase (PgdA/CDA1 family)|nr:polysaccharide deacetylase family protein [Bifidobacterium sp.]
MVSNAGDNIEELSFDGIAHGKGKAYDRDRYEDNAHNDNASGEDDVYFGANPEEAGVLADYDDADGIANAGDHGDPNPRRRRFTRLLALLALLAAAGAVAGGLWSYGMWENHWRRIPISVDGNARQVRVDTTLGRLMADNHDFGRKPGRLMAITGEVESKHGGEPIRYSINGRNVPASAIERTALPQDADIRLQSGKDKMEPYDKQDAAIPYQVKFTGRGAIQELQQSGQNGVREVWTGRVSGKKLNKGVIKQPRDLIVQAISPKPAGRKVIALTFDDGPSAYSAPILDILRSKGVKATFFDIGQSALQYPQVEQRMAAEGHQVASHSNTHPDMTKLSRDAERADIAAGLANLQKASGTQTKVFRPPYGAFGPQQWRNAADLIDCTVLWSIDTEDWRRPGAQAIHDAVIKNAYNGAIVLMHDGGGNRSQDIAALPGIIDDLKTDGFEFVTIDQLRAMK